MGVKTAVQYNYEFMDWVINPAYPKPDMLIAPSRWHFEDVQKWCDENNVKHIYLHCPVARDQLPFRKISQARTFLHMAGRAAAHDRNGTATVIKASRYLTSQAKIVVHFQGEQGLAHQATNSVADYARFLEMEGSPNRVTMVVNEVAQYSDLYAMGDVLLLPRRYGGNCLPLNEALSVGMPVIMTAISPNKDFLPAEWLLPAVMINQFTPRTVIDIYSADPQLLARKIDDFYNMTEPQMLAENQRANELAETISWDKLKPKYIEAFEALCTPK
jgi:glycosyltransferase involved in cell wall biosynthesis